MWQSWEWNSSEAPHKWTSGRPFDRCSPETLLSLSPCPSLHLQAPRIGTSCIPSLRETASLPSISFPARLCTRPTCGRWSSPTRPARPSASPTMAILSKWTSMTAMTERVSSCYLPEDLGWGGSGGAALLWCARTVSCQPQSPHGSGGSSQSCSSRWPSGSMEKRDACNAGEMHWSFPLCC